MKTSEVSKRYAKALLAVVKQKSHHSQTLSELKIVLDLLSKDQAVDSYFNNPLISSMQKVTVVKAALANKGLSEDVFNTILLMAEKNRIQILPQMIQSFQNYLDIEEGITRGDVKSAQPLSVEAKAQLETKLSNILNRKILLTYKQDPKLLGGVVAQVGGWTFDDSIETHLKKINEELNRRAN